jgi:cobalt-precorrin-6B (C15)-methyltransferase
MKIAVPGIPDDQFQRGDVPMTKQEVRILALVKARIREADTVLDIGAGTGSLAVEAALLAPAGRVFAIERQAAGVDLIRANAANFGAANLTAIHGPAPDALAGLPPADVIFVGGSGGKLAAILDAADGLLKPGGRLVVTAVTVETLQQTLAWAADKDGYTVDAAGVQITRLRPLGRRNMFQALNQVYIIVCSKGETP